MNTAKKIALSVGVVVVVGAYVLFQYMDHSSAPMVAATTPPATGTPGPTATTTPATKPEGQYTDGSYTGAATDAFYGTVQVKAVITNGALADVQFLQYPNNPGNTLAINQRVMPILRQEAITAQSPKVNTISGATQTSQGFVTSLTSALAQAKVQA
jgi:uncharacterized protein with FMN-binding domain